MLPNKRITVLIAEDEYLISLDVSHAATVAGFEVVGVASNGEQAIDMVRHLSPQALILDIKMPKLDGLATARKIRDETPLPVVIMTAYETQEFLAEAKKAGVGAYLVKPPKAAMLQRAVELAVARHADLMELRRINRELEQAQQRANILEGFLPICASCKKVRDDQGYWQQVEAYISQHSNIQFSHGICPDCIRILYPEFADRIKT
jgi:AmiR/NasT family two-component response regulator